MAWVRQQKCAIKLCYIIQLYQRSKPLISLQNKDSDPYKLFDALENSLVHSKTWRIFGQAAIQKGDKLAHIKDMMKDINYVQKLAEEMGCPLYLTQSAINLLEMAMNKGMGMNDVSDLIKLYSINPSF